MLYLNADEEKRLVFEMEIHGVETKDLHGSVRFFLHGVEYGFPAEIESNRITALIPPLSEIFGQKIEDGAIVEAKLELFTDKNYFKPWNGEIKLEAPMKIKAKLEGEDKSKIGIRTKLINAVLTEEAPSKKETKVDHDEKSIKENDSLKKAVMSVMSEMGLAKSPQRKSKIIESPQQKKKVELSQSKKAPNLLEGKTQQEAINDFIQEKLMSVGKSSKPRENKRVLTKEDLVNITENQIYNYMERAGTKNTEVQRIIFEQASQGAKSNYDILRNVVQIVKRKK